MKTKALILAIVIAVAQAAAAEDNVDECATDTIEQSPNALIEIITIPFKMVFALTYGPRCLLESIPKNEK